MMNFEAIEKPLSGNWRNDCQTCGTSWEIRVVLHAARALDDGLVVACPACGVVALVKVIPSPDDQPLQLRHDRFLCNARTGKVAATAWWETQGR